MILITKKISISVIYLIIIFLLLQCSNETVVIPKQDIVDSADTDGDGIINSEDKCPLVPDPDQYDADNDGFGDECDTCIDTENIDQSDTDGDGTGDACELPPTQDDSDGDGIIDSEDLCPNTNSTINNDTDGDGVGDVCELPPTQDDSDGDGIIDSEDLCPNTNNTNNNDTDGDGVGDICDAKSWVHPKDLDDNVSKNDNSAVSGQVAMGDNGNAIVVWRQQKENNKYQVFKSEYRNGKWDNPSSISLDSDDPLSPLAAMDHNGNAIVVWSQSDGTHKQIFKREYRDGGWDLPITLNDHISPDGGDATDPKVAMDNNGNAIIVWSQSNGTYKQIFKSEYRNERWDQPETLDDNISPDGQNALYPQVAMDNSGNAIIIWNQNSIPTWRIYKSEYRNGGWDHPSDLTDYFSSFVILSGLIESYPQVAMNDHGDAIIAWTQNVSGKTHIFKSEYRDTAWSYPNNLDDNISPDGQNAEQPQIAMDNNGNAIIVWKQKNEDNKYHVFKSEYRNESWNTPRDLNDNISPVGQDANYPKVAMDNYGNAIITWSEKDENNEARIFMSELKNDNWTIPNILSGNISPSHQYALYPKVAMDEVGHGIILWHQMAEGRFHIYKSEYR